MRLKSRVDKLAGAEAAAGVKLETVVLADAGPDRPAGRYPDRGGRRLTIVLAPGEKPDLPAGPFKLYRDFDMADLV